MQIPASAAPNPATTTTMGAQNGPAGVSSSAFGRHGGTAATKKGQLPAFAAILAEQSVDTDVSKDDAGKLVSTEDGGADALLEGALPGMAHAGPEFQALLLAGEVKTSKDARPDTTASGKSETRATRHRIAGEAPSTGSGKKEHAAAADAVPVSAAGIPAFPLHAVPVSVSSMPAPSAGQWAPTAHASSLPQNAPPIQQPLMGLQGTKEEPRVHIASPESPSATISDASLTLAKETPKTTLSQPHLVSSEARIAAASTDIEPSTIAVAGPTSVREASPIADLAALPGLSDEANRLLSPLAGAAAVSQAAASTALKARTQEKTSSDGVHSPSASAPGISFTDWMRANGDTPAMASPVRTADVADTAGRQGAVMPEANAFQRLDGGEAPATLLHSSAHQIAIGVHDPALGWLEVQTQSSAGHISATLTAASTEAHASLAAQAPAITQYLADRDVSVHSLNVHTQAEMQGSASGGGQSQPGPGNAREEVSERGNVVAGERRQQSFGGTSEANSPQAGSASYISVRA